MSDTRPPGQVAYEAYCEARDPWASTAFRHLPPEAQHWWEAAAQAVLDAWQAQPRLETPRRPGEGLWVLPLPPGEREEPR